MFLWWGQIHPHSTLICVLFWPFLIYNPYTQSQAAPYLRCLKSMSSKNVFTPNLSKSGCSLGHIIRKSDPTIWRLHETLRLVSADNAFPFFSCPVLGSTVASVSCSLPTAVTAGLILCCCNLSVSRFYVLSTQRSSSVCRGYNEQIFESRLPFHQLKPVWTFRYHQQGIFTQWTAPHRFMPWNVLEKSTLQELEAHSKLPCDWLTRYLY